MKAAANPCPGSLFLVTLALCPSHPQVLTAGWGALPLPALSTARPTPGAMEIRRHSPAEPECPEGCHRLGFSSLCHGRWRAHFSYATTSALMAQRRLFWVWQHPLLPQPSPHRERNSRFARSEGTRYNPFIPICMVPEDHGPGSDTFAYNCLFNFIDYCWIKRQTVPVLQAQG